MGGGLTAGGTKGTIDHVYSPTYSVPRYFMARLAVTLAVPQIFAKHISAERILKHYYAWLMESLVPIYYTASYAKQYVLHFRFTLFRYLRRQ